MRKIPHDVPQVKFTEFLKHPVLINRGLVLAHRLNCRFVGLWPGGAMEFHDHHTNGGFTIPVTASTIWHAKGRLLQLRSKFEDNHGQERVFARVDDILDGRN